MVGAVRLELTTYRVKAGYSSRLSYTPIIFRTFADFRFDERFRLLNMFVSCLKKGWWVQRDSNSQLPD